MKIMFCLGSMNKGGAERVVSNLSNELSKKNHIIIVTTIKSNCAYELDEKIDLKYLDENKNKNFFYKNIKRIKKLNKIIKKENPDIIISFLPEPTYRVMFVNAFRRKKVIISVRNDPNKEYNNWFKKLLVKLLYTKADGFIFQTPDAQKWFSKKIQAKSIVIPNPINEQFICEPYKGQREKVIVNVGRLTEQKNQKLLIDAFYEIHKRYPDYVLKIYGEGSLRNDLESQIEKMGLKDKVLLMGEINNIKDEIYKSSMFVLSSDYEGMPNTLMEAMALGIPCISTDCPIGGPKYLIENNISGILVKVNDKEELINAIDRIINDKELLSNLSINANKICDELNPSKINKKWEDYINLIK